MNLQATTNIQKPLATASRITENGNHIVLDDVDSGSNIDNKKTGMKIPLKMENGVYMVEMLVKAPFPRPAKK